MRRFSDLNRIESVLPNRGVGVVGGGGCGGGGGGVLCHCGGVLCHGPAFCLSVCLFVFGEAKKIKIQYFHFSA